MSMADQLQLQATARKSSLMDQFLAIADNGLPQVAMAPLRAFVATCEAHGKMATHHVDSLVRRYVEQPSATMHHHMRQIKAVMAALEALRDKRLAANRQGIDSRYGDLERLRSLCGLGAKDERLIISN